MDRELILCISCTLVFPPVIVCHDSCGFLCLEFNGVNPLFS